MIKSQPSKRLIAIADIIRKINEDTPLKKRIYLGEQIIKLNYPKDLMAQRWWDAAWGRLAEQQTPLLETWYYAEQLPAVDIKIVRAIGSLRSALKINGIPKGNLLSPQNQEIAYWLYSIHDLSPEYRARILAATTVNLPKDMKSSLYNCWSESWTKIDKNGKNLPDTLWEWIGPKVFDDSPTAMQYLCIESNMEPVLESMLQESPEASELPLLWKPHL